MANKFLKGLITKNKHPNAPDFIIGSISMKVEEIIPAIQESSKNGWVNLQASYSKDGKFQIMIDDWEPNKNQSAPPQAPTYSTSQEESLPF